jgi:hypothetical protein
VIGRTSMVKNTWCKFSLYIHATQLPPYAMRTYLHTHSWSFIHNSDHVGKNIAQSSPKLLNCRLDLCWGKNEAVGTGVAHLNGHRILGLGDFVRIVDRVARDSVDGRADRAGLIGKAVGSLDSGDGTGDERFVGSGFGDDARAGVSVSCKYVRKQLTVDGRMRELTVHPKLGVRVDIHVELDTLACRNAVELGLQGLSLNAVTSRWATVILSAGRSGGTTADAPLIGPVAVDVTANTAG